MATTTFTVPVPTVQTTGGFFKIVTALCLLSLLLWFIRTFYLTMMSQSQAASAPSPSNCTMTGLPSTKTDGSDCCTGSMDFNNVCQPPPSTSQASQPAACVPDGQPSQYQGADCCSGSGLDSNGNCSPPTLYPIGAPPTSSSGAPMS